MSKKTPLEQAEEFLEASTGPGTVSLWVGKAWGADGAYRYVTRDTLRALVDQIQLDEKRIAELGNPDLSVRMVPGVHDTCVVCSGAVDYVEVTRNDVIVGHLWLHREQAEHDPSFGDES